MSCRSELKSAICREGNIIKLCCGIANNAAWSVALEAIDHARQCRDWKTRTKQLYNRCAAAWHAYEVGLVYGPHSRCFRVDAMPEDSRSRYGNISDREYYEFWCAAGATLNAQHRGIITSLQNKYCIFLDRQHIGDANHLAWVLTAQATLILADRTYEERLNLAAKDSHIPRNILETYMRPFSIKNVSQAWQRATLSLFPRLHDLSEDKTGDRNIELGILQLSETWNTWANVRQAYMTTAEDFPEMFRTKGELKRALQKFENAV